MLTPTLRATFVVLFLACLSGCSQRGGKVTLESTTRGRTLTQEFQQAYVGSPKAGEYDIIFVDNGADWNYRKPKRNRPLEPTPLSPVRQVMHIHLYWRPLAGTTKNPAAINAVIDWYVLGPDGSNDLLVYSGAGLVSVTGGRDFPTVTIREGRLHPKSGRGEMADPVGVATVTGVVKAERDESKVRETLAEMQETAAGATEIAGP